MELFKKEPGEDAEPAKPKLAPSSDKKNLITELGKLDRPMCLPCLILCKTETEHLCTTTDSHSQCQNCRDSGKYCLRLKVNESRPIFRMAQKFQAELAEQRVKGRDPSPSQMHAYNQIIDCAINFAETCRDIKDRTEDAEKASAENMKILRRAASCKSEKQAYEWAAQCGWELAQMEAEVTKSRQQNQQQQKKKRKRDGSPDLQPAKAVGLKELLAELKSARDKRDNAEMKAARLVEQVKDLKSENKELDKAKVAAAASRDRATEELENSRADVLAVRAALERAEMLRTSQAQLGGLPAGKSASQDVVDRTDNVEEIDSDSTLGAPAPDLNAIDGHSNAATAGDSTAPAAPVVFSNVWRKLPERFRQLIFHYILQDIPSIWQSLQNQRTAIVAEMAGLADDKAAVITGPTVNTETRTAVILYHLGRGVDLESHDALNAYISANSGRVFPGGGDAVNWPRRDHERVMTLCLVSKEWMVRVLKAQAAGFAKMSASIPSVSGPARALERRALGPAKRPALADQAFEGSNYASSSPSGGPPKKQKTIVYDKAYR